MHEYGIIQSLLRCVEREVQARGATAVHRVAVRVGELSGVDGALLALAFETFRAKTVCAEAQLTVVEVAADWRCSGCGRALPRGALLRCATCDLPACLTAGGEIILDRIEMEVPDV